METQGAIFIRGVLVSCHTSRVASARPPWSVARRAPQGMARIPLPRGATRPQAKGDAPFGSERSAPLRRCSPWQYAGVFPAGCVLHWRAPFTLMRLYSCDTTLITIAVSLFILGGWMVYLKEAASSVSAFGGGVMSFVLANLREFKRIGGFGIQAERLEEKVREADIVIDLIRSIAAEVSAPILTIAARLARLRLRPARHV